MDTRISDAMSDRKWASSRRGISPPSTSRPSSIFSLRACPVRFALPTKAVWSSATAALTCIRTDRTVWQHGSGSRPAVELGHASQGGEGVGGIGSFVDHDGDLDAVFGGCEHRFNDLGHLVCSEADHDETLTRRLNDLKEHAERLAEWDCFRRGPGPDDLDPLLIPSPLDSKSRCAQGNRDGSSTHANGLGPRAPKGIRLRGEAGVRDELMELAERGAGGFTPSIQKRCDRLDLLEWQRASHFGDHLVEACRRHRGKNSMP